MLFTDLVHWEERPSSVVPDDWGSNHSGGAVVDHSTMQVFSGELRKP